MSVPSAGELETRFFPKRPRDLSPKKLDTVREHSKKMFGNRDRLEVAVVVDRVELGRVNATDLNRAVDLAVNRIRSQLLALESLGLLRRTGNEQNKRMFEQVNPEDRFWKFAAEEYGEIVGEAEAEPSRGGVPGRGGGLPLPRPAEPRRQAPE